MSKLSEAFATWKLHGMSHNSATDNLIIAIYEEITKDSETFNVKVVTSENLNEGVEPTKKTKSK